MTNHRVVSETEWVAERKKLLAKEKEFTHLRDKINAERLELPWARVEKEYSFDTPKGKKKLSDLFDGRSQLVVYHFMLGPDWPAGCPGCSFVCDHIDGALPHLEHHDVTFTAISRAPLPQIELYKSRMGWKFPWASAFGSDFNYDYHVSFTPDQIATGKLPYNYADMPVSPDSKSTEMFGLSSFQKDEKGNIFHTYSTYHRGCEELIGTLMILDRAPKGRNEKKTMDFLRRHDEYDTAPKPAGRAEAATS